jgi:hypothetical protein
VRKCDAGRKGGKKNAAQHGRLRPWQCAESVDSAVGQRVRCSFFNSTCNPIRFFLLDPSSYPLLLIVVPPAPAPPLPAFRFQFSSTSSSRSSSSLPSSSSHPDLIPIDFAPTSQTNRYRATQFFLRPSQQIGIRRGIFNSSFASFAF